MNRRKVLLVGWDAADWKVIHPLMAAGKMPNVRRLVAEGASGQIATLHPPLSPMLWTSIATGKRPFKHGIFGFSEPTSDGCGVQPVTNLSRKSKALWNILNQNGLRSVVIGWWPSHPAEPINGVMVSDRFHRVTAPLDEGWPLIPNAIHPPELAKTLADLRMHPDQLVHEMVEPFIPLAREIDQDKDDRLALCLRTLAECKSIQSAAGWLLDNQPWDLFAVYYDSIDHFSHGFMRYHPPRQPWIAERDFALYRNVVSMAYQLHDQMLGDLLKKAGEDVTVVLLSDHGFHPDHLRPSSIPEIPAGPAIEHRDLGVLVISGPGIKKNEILHGPSLLDIAPTILTLYGLPVGEDMDGNVLTQAFAEPPPIARVPSWDHVPGADGCHPSHTRIDPVAAHEALEQMIALGYIERPDENRALAVQNTVRELRYNLGESYQDDDRHTEAHEIFTELYAADPGDQRFAVRLFAACQALGMLDEMRRIVDDLDGRRALFEQAKSKTAELRATEPRDHRELARFQPAVVDYLKARLLTAEQRYPEALAALERMSSANPVRPALLLETADVYLRLHRWSDARQIFQKLLIIDPDDARAHLGMCRVALHRRKFSAAAQSALDALQRIHRYPLAHFLLGRALDGMKDYDGAAEAYRAAIWFNPHFPEAHLRLAAVLERHLGDSAAAREHRRLVRRMKSRSSRPAKERSAAAVTELSDMPAVTAAMPLLEQSLTVVTGLPRSGTSMLMQMLAGGGMPVLSDGIRGADEDNPRGYLEFDPVKNLLHNANCLREALGKAVKIIVPLLGALPADLPCRVILIERHLDEVLDSQERMLAHRHQLAAATPNRRQMLKSEYVRAVSRAKAILAERPFTQLLVLEHRKAISDPRGTAERLNDFLGGSLNAAKMAAAIDPVLHRNRVTRELTGVNRSA